MGLSKTGKSCLLTARVTGCKRVPAPPAKMIPLEKNADDAIDSPLGSSQSQPFSIICAGVDASDPLQMV
jgi:hypothetical protein